FRPLRSPRRAAVTLGAVATKRGSAPTAISLALRVMALVMAAATAVSAGPSSAAASERWRHVALSRHKARVEATLSYDRRRAGGLHEYRRVSLVVRRAGVVVIRDRADAQARLGDVRDLSLRNVWGSAQPEALVELWT